MALLIDISSHLEVTEHGMDGLRMDRPSAVNRRPHSSFTGQPVVRAVRGNSSNHAKHDQPTQELYTPALADLSDAVRD